MIPILFALILIGHLIGKIRFCGVRFGLAGVLIISLLTGGVIGNYTIIFDETMESTCNFLSSFGTSLFIAVIGLQAGEMFTTVKGKKQWKALFGGIGVVMIGAIVLIVCALIDSSLLKDLLLGIFAGSMTSTPAMSAALETYGSASSVAIGYGISYWIGLLSVVLFVQLFRLPYAACRNDRQQNHEKSIPHTADIVKRLNQTDSLMLLSGTVLIGSILSLILPIGNTGGVLVSGLLIGFLVRKRGKLLCDLAAYKSLGLILFFIGNGIPAGVKLNTGLSWCYFFYGAMISVLAIGLGYSLIHFVLRFSKSDTLAILCGGMTSTPAIGVLQDRDQDTDLSLYATSYVGALITLLVFVQIIVRVWM